MKLNAVGLPATTTCMVCADNNPFFEIYRGSHNDSTSYFKVYDSDIVNNTVSPTYPKFTLTG